jgi:multiple sugar transport system substrate-binding protein
MKKKLILTFVSCLGVLVLAGCNGISGGSTSITSDTDDSGKSSASGGASGSATTKTTLKFFGWGSVAEQAIFKTMISEFTAENPQYDVVYSSVTSDNYITTLGSYKNNTRNMPDVFYMPDINFVQWIQGDTIMMDLTPYIQKSTVMSLDNLWPQGVTAYSYDSSAKKLGTGDVYALPKDLGPNVLVYNKTLAASKGLTVISDASGDHNGYNPTTKTLNDKVPMTWAQFISFCSDLKEGSLTSSNSIVGVTHYPLESAMASMNQRFLDSTNKTVTINNANYAECLQYVADLSNKYGVMTTAEGQSSQNGFQRFTSGLAGSSFVGAWDTPDLWECNFDWDILYTPVPNASGDLSNWQEGYRDGCSSRGYLGSVGLSVYKNTRSPEGAYKLAEFLSAAPSGQRLNYQMGQAVPNLMDMAKGEFLTSDLDDPLKATYGHSRPANRIVYDDMMASSERRPQAYTYNSDWYDNMWECSDDTYKLFRVWSTDASAYGGHMDVFDWNTRKQINPDVLSGLQSSCQDILDQTRSRYSW